MPQRSFSRRNILKCGIWAGSAAILGHGRLIAAAASPALEDIVQETRREVIREGRNGGVTWFHPRPCLLPGSPATLLMTVQTISGSDLFGPVCWSQSQDGGATWTDPQPIPGLGRRRIEADLEEGACDVVPQYHPQTRSVLAAGHSVFYRKNALFRPQPPRHPVYVVRDADGRWSEPRALKWDDPRGAGIYTCGCGQRALLPDGDVLIPISFNPKDREDRAVACIRCSFDGRELAIRQISNELRLPVKRGLLEPSVVFWNDRYFLTIRAEDKHGHVAASADPMRWPDAIPWTWDDGTAVTMSTTQQHWLAHSDALHLVYTRQDKSNAKVFRWRAPLYMCRVDPATLRLVRSTERIILPLVGDGVKDGTHVVGMGNFHTVNVNANESLVTVGEEFPANQWHGDLLAARIRWKMPNRLV